MIKYNSRYENRICFQAAGWQETILNARNGKFGARNNSIPGRGLSVLKSNERTIRGQAMPIYEYQCSRCGHQLESMQKMSEPPLKDCPVCHEPALNKLVSAAGFQLKGSGWYVTDYSAKGKAKVSQEPVNKPAETKEGDKGSSSNTGAK